MSDKDDKAAYAGDEGNSKPKPSKATVTPDKSFIESDGYKLNGLELRPYSPERMWAADAMGLRYGHLSEAASKQYFRNGTYPGMEGDVGIVIWLCSLPDGEEVRAARRDPGQAEFEALAFAEKHKIMSGKQSGFWDAFKLFKSIMLQVHAAYGEPEKKEQKKTTKA